MAIMEYQFKGLLFISFAIVFISLANASYDCYDATDFLFTNGSTAYTVWYYGNVTFSGETCTPFWIRIGDPDFNVGNNNWRLNKYNNINTSIIIGFKPFGDRLFPPYYKSIYITFKNITEYYTYYNYKYDINNSNTSIIIPFVKLTNYTSFNHTACNESFNYSFIANHKILFYNSTLCSEGKCNYFKLDLPSVDYETKNITIGVGSQPGTSCGANIFDTYLTIYYNGSLYFNGSYLYTPTYNHNVTNNNIAKSNYTAITPTLLDQLVYIANAPEVKQYGIFIDYSYNRYIITSGLEKSESFYSDSQLRHYVDCNLTDGVDNFKSIIMYTSSDLHFVDISSYCDYEINITEPPLYNNTTNITELLGCGIYGLNVLNISNNSFVAYQTLPNSIIYNVVYTYTNGTTVDYSASGAFTYSDSNVSMVRLYCNEKLVDVLSLQPGGNTIIGSQAIIILFIFLGIFGLMFFSKSFFVSLVVTTLILLLLSEIGFIYIDTAMLIAIIILGLVIFAAAEKLNYFGLLGRR